jgi:hypothetical protein
MQRDSRVQKASGAKALAINERAAQAHNRFLQLMALILSASFALALQLLFGR